MSELKLVQIHGAGSPNKGKPTLGLSMRVPDEFARKLKIQRGDFVLVAVTERGMNVHTIDQSALTILLKTVESDPAPESETPTDPPRGG